MTDRLTNRQLRVVCDTPDLAKLASPEQVHEFVVELLELRQRLAAMEAEKSTPDADRQRLTDELNELRRFAASARSRLESQTKKLQRRQDSLDKACARIAELEADR